MPGQKIAEEERKQQILTAALQVATQIGLENVTGRRVAAEAGLSSGLIFFHYKTKDDLLLALLDELITWWLSTREIHATDAQSRFLELVRLEAQVEDRAFIDLLLEFWILGRHHLEMRSRLRDAMAKYRERFRLAAQQMIQQSENKTLSVPAESLAIFASSLVIGNALQVMFDPEQFNTEELLLVAKALFEDL
ncbi:MAG: TetR/AcrR family transcriptional regulator [Cyanobacteria bacterium RM1_2_2]|nr:TetR/AcrR family transcriptional regulator [Cyanobacteria bacterium RM1_2_2]